MQKSAFVRIVDRTGDRRHQAGRGLCVVAGPLATQRLDLVRKAFALDELHAEVGAALKLGDLVNRYDMRMVEIGGELGFAKKAGTLVTGGHLARQDHLEGDQSVSLALPAL